MEYKEYGHWSEDGKEYIITERKTPRHWYNYYFNDTYNAFASQVGFGEGFCQDQLGNRIPLVTDRCVYFVDRESRSWHTGVGLPMQESFDQYECRHGLGYSTIMCEKNGIRSEYTIFVPAEGNCEEWIVRVSNLRNTEAKLSVIGYAATDCDGKYTPQGYNSFSAELDREIDALCAKIAKNFDGPKRFTYAYMQASEPIKAYDTRKNAFLGVYGAKECPEALELTGGCTNSPTCVEKICFAIENECTLGVGESKTLAFRIGHALKKEDISHTLSMEVVQEALETVRTTRLAEIDGVLIETPDERLNLAFNSFYKYATNMGSRWARVRHNGYRDMASDTECLGAFNPTLAWERFKRILTYQYSNGYCPRTFIDGKIKPNNFSDCAVWITFTAHTLIMELGDLSLLDQEVAFNDGSVATVFEHLRRAVDYLYHFQGMHGLIRIWGGDWNDGMNKAGLKELGVSVWLSIAWYRANNLFLELASLLGRDDLLAQHRQMGEDMREKIEQYGFDGDYYITAINDKGEKIGSKESREGKFYLNPQLWAVFSGIAPREKLERIMAEIDRQLERPLGTLVNYPAYTDYDPFIGNMTAQPAGTLINQGVYLHPMAWKLAAEAIMKRPERVQMTLEKILPWDHTHAPTCGEPYILYNFYYGEESGYRCGTPGQSWRTATTQWVVRALVHFVFGLKPDLNGMRLDPCLPPAWEHAKITKRFRGATYEIVYRQAKGTKGEIDRITVDGAPLDGTCLPCDGKSTYQVEVLLK